MSCTGHREALVQMARGGEEDPPALLHAQDCAACGALLADERTLSQGLRTLARHDAGREAPPWVEDQLRMRLSATRGAARAQRRRTLPLLVAAAAAVILVMAAVLLPQSPAPPPAPQARMREEAEFLPLVYGEPLDGADALHLTRISVPRHALASWGWSGEMEDGPPLEAEVLVGQDGLARGIRFVNAAGDPPR